jgi:hypothetical protein
VRAENDFRITPAKKHVFNGFSAGGNVGASHVKSRNATIRGGQTRGENFGQEAFGTRSRFDI